MRVCVCVCVAGVRGGEEGKDKSETEDRVELVMREEVLTKACSFFVIAVWSIVMEMRSQWLNLLPTPEGSTQYLS